MCGLFRWRNQVNAHSTTIDFILFLFFFIILKSCRYHVDYMIINNKFACLHYAQSLIRLEIYFWRAPKCTQIYIDWRLRWLRKIASDNSSVKFLQIDCELNIFHLKKFEFFSINVKMHGNRKPKTDIPCKPLVHIQ